LFCKPLRDLTLTEAMSTPVGHLASIRPAAMMGGQFLPGAITRRAARRATLQTIIHPGQAPPERHYRPSQKLADFVRCRDLTCRFPGCTEPATNCDVDHTIPWPYGPTQAANLKCLCRKHYLLKTFWGGEGGWRDRQEPDGTKIFLGYTLWGDSPPGWSPERRQRPALAAQPAVQGVGQGRLSGPRLRAGELSGSTAKGYRCTSMCAPVNCQ
jgi:hypothetical protein